MIESFAGYRPRSWLGPGLGETQETPDHLVAAGIRYIFEWCLDDVPVPLETKHGAAYAMPYALELNDVTIFAIEKHVSHVYLERFSDAADALARDAAPGPKVLTLAVHPYIMAQPHRLACLERTIDMLRQRDDTVFMTCDAIGDWFDDAYRRHR